MSKFAQGQFVVKNPHKYAGKGAPRFRSGWEFAFMTFCDNNEHIVQWASESISIPYRNPITGKQSIYVPDFFITYRTKNNTMIAELVEIKPKAQAVMELARSQQEKAAVALNMCKWAAAQAWCKRMGATFRLLTEEEIFNNVNPTRKRRR